MARPSRKEEITEKVLAAALELIAEGGFEQSPMSKLAKLAGVSVGTIYLYFPSKDELIAALFEDIRKTMQEEVLRDYDAKKSIAKRFDLLFLNIANYYVANKRHFVFIDQFTLSSYNKSSLEAFSDEVAGVITTLYEDGIKQGVLKPLHAEVVVALTYGPIISLVKKHHTGFVKATPELIAELKSCVWEAVSV